MVHGRRQAVGNHCLLEQTPAKLKQTIPCHLGDEATLTAKLGQEVGGFLNRAGDHVREK